MIVQSGNEDAVFVANLKFASVLSPQNQNDKLGSVSIKVKQKDFKIRYTNVATPEQSKEIIKKFAKEAIKKALVNNGAVSTNLEEVLDKYIR